MVASQTKRPENGRPPPANGDVRCRPNSRHSAIAAEYQPTTRPTPSEVSTAQTFSLMQNTLQQRKRRLA